MLQTVRPPEEWSPPPQDIDPDQLFGTFTGPDAGISLIGAVRNFNLSSLVYLSSTSKSVFNTLCKYNVTISEYNITEPI